MSRLYRLGGEAVQALGWPAGALALHMLPDGVAVDPNYGDPCAFWSESAYTNQLAGTQDPSTGFEFPATLPAYGVEQSAAVSSNPFATGGSIFVLGDAMLPGVSMSYANTAATNTSSALAVPTVLDNAWPSWLPFTEAELEDRGQVGRGRGGGAAGARSLYLTCQRSRSSTRGASSRSARFAWRTITSTTRPSPYEHTFTAGVSIEQLQDGSIDPTLPPRRQASGKDV